MPQGKAFKGGRKEAVEEDTGIRDHVVGLKRADCEKVTFNGCRDKRQRSGLLLLSEVSLATGDASGRSINVCFSRK